MLGMKRVVAENKIQSGASLDEGKKAMIFEVNKSLCEEVYKVKGEDYLIAYTLLTMEWNLMARSENCVNMHVQHIQWRSDYLSFYFGILKGNQTGERSNDTWHVYSNPKNPTVFPVIDIAKYLLSHPYILTTN